MYKIFTAVWPSTDIKNYFAVTEKSDTSYSSLKAFLSITKSQLNKIFRPKPNWTTVSGMELAIEAKKFHAELFKDDNLMKFLY